MRRMFINWVISALALLLAAAALRQGVTISPWWHVIWMAPLLGLINAIVSGLIGFFGFPLNLLTLGCFGFVASFLLYAAAIYFLQQYTRGILTVESFWWALALAAVMALFSAVLNMFLGGDDRRR